MTIGELLKALDPDVNVDIYKDFILLVSMKAGGHESLNDTVLAYTCKDGSISIVTRDAFGIEVRVNED